MDDGSPLLTVIIACAVIALVISLLKGFLAPPELQAAPQRAAPGPQAQGRTAQGRPSTSTAAAVAAAAQPQAARRAPSAVRTITISVPGVLIEESSPEALLDGATVVAAATAAARTAAGAGCALYLLCQVADDVGEAVVRAALEHSGLVGTGVAAVPPQRLLFCSTTVGKVSAVRQLEPDLHVDSDAETIRQLHRFLPRLAAVGPAAAAAAEGTGPHVAPAATLTQALAAVGLVD